MAGLKTNIEGIERQSVRLRFAGGSKNLYSCFVIDSKLSLPNPCPASFFATLSHPSPRTSCRNSRPFPPSLVRSGSSGLSSLSRSSTPFCPGSGPTLLPTQRLYHIERCPMCASSGASSSLGDFRLGYVSWETTRRRVSLLVRLPSLAWLLGCLSRQQPPR